MCGGTEARPAVVVLAAGRGKRMRSDLPKVLHKVGGRTMLDMVIETARELAPSKIVVVVGYGREKVIPVLPAGVEHVVQEQQLGTGHAVRCAEGLLGNHPGPIVVLSGDVPLLRAGTVLALEAGRAKAGAACAVLTAIVAGEHSYGRIVRDAAGCVAKIVEDRDATPEERRIDEINTGTYSFAPGCLFPMLGLLRRDNAQGEYYLTDVVGLLIGRGMKVVCVRAESAEEALGVNSAEDLARAEAALAARRDVPATGIS
ncbi:MAG: NTP transferase domain-containing protein [Planctomycetota bacterium]|nr:NTP transferase domain-containing protein [Planctomycetota bacterium]